MPTNSYQILVLDANTRSALAVTRSLGKLPNLKIFCADSTIDSLSGSSRHCRRYLQHPCIKTEPISFLTWIKTLLAQNDIAAVFPTTEISSQLLLMHREILGNTVLPFANYEDVMALAHKGNLCNLGKKLGIPIPHTLHYENGSAYKPMMASRFPLVIKPCLSHIWTGNTWLSTSVHIAENQSELNSLISEKEYLANHPFLIQEFIPGHGAGIFALYNQGEPMAYFSHKRIREKPPEGGVSVLSESIPVRTDLHEYADKLLKKVNWHGVAMVEFRIDENGAPYLMEVNTRFWGSLQLAIDSGVDFPNLLWKASNGVSLQQVDSYIIGQRLRWILGDVDRLYLILKNRNLSFKKKLSALIQFFSLPDGNTSHEINRLEDFRPALYELRKYF